MHHIDICSLLVGLLFTVLLVDGRLSDFRKCADPKCEEIISKGHTVISYPAPSEDLLSFPNNADVQVFSKEAGSNNNLWGVEINRKRGYVPHKYVREDRILIKNDLLTHIVPVNSRTEAETKGTYIEVDQLQHSQEERLLKPDINKNEIILQEDYLKNIKDGNDGTLDNGEVMDEEDGDEEGDEEEGDEEDDHENDDENGAEDYDDIDEHEPNTVKETSIKETLVTEQASPDALVDEPSNTLNEVTIKPDSIDASFSSLNVVPTLSYEIVDGTKIYDEPEPFTISRPSLSGVQTSPLALPAPVVPVVQKTVLHNIPASEMVANKPADESSQDEGTPKLKIIPSGMPEQVSTTAPGSIDATSVYPDPLVQQMHVEQTAKSHPENTSAGSINPESKHVHPQPYGEVEYIPDKISSLGEVPPLLSTLSGGINDNSDVHATTATVPSSDSSEDIGRKVIKTANVADDIERVSDGEDSSSRGNDGASGAADDADTMGTEADVEINPTVVDNQPEGWLSSLTSTVGKMFAEASTTEGNDETAIDAAGMDNVPAAETESKKVGSAGAVDGETVAETVKYSVVGENKDESVDHVIEKTADIVYPKPDDIISVEEISSVKPTNSMDNEVHEASENNLKLANEKIIMNNKMQNEISENIFEHPDHNKIDTQTNMKGSGNSATEQSEEFESRNKHEDAVADSASNIEPQLLTSTNSGDRKEKESNQNPFEGNEEKESLEASPNEDVGLFASLFDSGTDNTGDDKIDDVKTGDQLENSKTIQNDETIDKDLELGLQQLLEGTEERVVLNENYNSEAAVESQSTSESSKDDVDSSNLSEKTNLELEQNIHFITTTPDKEESSVESNINGVSGATAATLLPEASEATENEEDIPDVHRSAKDESPPAESSAESTDEATESQDNEGNGLPEEGVSEDSEQMDSGYNISDAGNIPGDTTEAQHHGTSSNDGEAGAGPDMHDPDSIAGHILQAVEPLMMWLAGHGQKIGEGLTLGMEREVSQPEVSRGSLVLLLVLAATVVLLYSVAALIKQCSREGPLLEALNALEHEQHISGAVIQELSGKLEQAMSSSAGSQLSSAQDTAEITRLAELLREAQESHQSAVARVQELEQEVEESASSGLEMHAMLQDLLHTQRDTASFQEAIDSLQAMLDNQREKVESLTADLSIKTTLNEELKTETKTSREKLTKLEFQLEQVSHSLEEASRAKTEVHALLTEEQSRGRGATEQLDALSKSSSDATVRLVVLEQQHKDLRHISDKLRKSLRTREAELQVSKECLKQLKVFNDGKGSKEKLGQLLNVIKVRSELAGTEQERSSLEEQLVERGRSLEELQQAVKEAQTQAEELKSTAHRAEEDRAEALSKLAVLTDYWKEKETQLTKELESESGLRQNAEGSAESVSSRIRNYDMQLLAYKTQVEGLKKELEDQEQSYRAQLAAQEQKAHESWVAARASERKCEESKQESSQMRSRLLLMSKENGTLGGKAQPIQPEKSNGSVVSPRPPLHDDLDGEHSPIPPPHMLPPHMFPPPPLPGMPPFPLPPGMQPPPPFLHPPHLPPPPPMSDRRLPPAGRLASPPFHRRMGGVSPPPFIDRHSPPPYDRRSYSPGSEHSRYSDRRYSPDRHYHHDRYSDRHSERYSDRPYNDRPSDRYSDRPSDRYSPPPQDRRDCSPDRWYNRSPDGGYARKSSPTPPPLPRKLYDDDLAPPAHRKGKKTSTPLGPNDR